MAAADGERPSVAVVGGENGDKSNSSQKSRVVAKGDDAGRRKKKKPVVAKDKVKSSQKAPASGFATTDKPFATTKKQGKFTTGNLESYGDEGHAPYQGVNKNEWRIIYRMMPPKKDGSRTISYYYKKRTSYVNKDGKREVPYLKGNKVTTDGTKSELQAHKERSRESD